MVLQLEPLRACATITTLRNPVQHALHERHTAPGTALAHRNNSQCTHLLFRCLHGAADENHDALAVVLGLAMLENQLHSMSKNQKKESKAVAAEYACLLACLSA